MWTIVGQRDLEYIFQDSGEETLEDETFEV